LFRKFCGGENGLRKKDPDIFIGGTGSFCDSRLRASGDAFGRANRQQCPKRCIPPRFSTYRGTQLIAERMKSSLGQSVIIENVAGAGDTIAAGRVGLLSYGSDYGDIYRRVAAYVDRILRGAKPADLPVQQPTKFRVILDDPHNVIKAESDLEREKTVRFVRESMSNRINDERSAIVIIMQRLHEGDVSGDILARESDYCHLMIPMYFDALRYPASADGMTDC
jgi:hypothetical protein